jgi:hypothetical protein
MALQHLAWFLHVSGHAPVLRQVVEEQRLVDGHQIRRFPFCISEPRYLASAGNHRVSQASTSHHTAMQFELRPGGRLRSLCGATQGYVCPEDMPFEGLAMLHDTCTERSACIPGTGLPAPSQVTRHEVVFRCSLLDIAWAGA